MVTGLTTSSLPMIVAVDGSVSSAITAIGDDAGTAGAAALNLSRAI